MKKKSVRRCAICAGIVAAILVAIAVVPGFSFHYSIKGVFAVMKKSSSDHQEFGVSVAGVGLKYEWHAADNPTIDGPKGFSMIRDRPFLRIGNVEFKVVSR